MDIKAERSTPETLEVKFDTIPAELQAFGTWVVWNYELIDGDLKKPPFSPKTGKRASVKDQSSWGSFDDARNAYGTGNWRGIGLVLPSDMKIGLVGIDIDHCLTASGNTTIEALHIISALDTYTEISPSGSGIHLWVRGSLPGKYRRKGNVEMYEDGRYITVTGHTIHGSTSILSRDTARLTAIYQDIFVYPVAENTVGGAQVRPGLLLTIQMSRHLIEDIQLEMEIISEGTSKAIMRFGKAQARNTSVNQTQILY